MLNRRLLGWPLLGLLLASCVTINIYFPEAAAEEAARTIVRDVLGKEQEQNTPPPPGEPQSSLPQRDAAVRVVRLLIDALVPAAHAAQANIDISSPAIASLRRSMEARQQQLAPFYRSGAIGFGNNGMLAMRDPAAVSLRDRNRLRQLVADENADRGALYREIANANGHPEWESQVRDTFARVWAQEARAGYWYQAGDGSWRQR